MHLKPLLVSVLALSFLGAAAPACNKEESKSDDDDKGKKKKKKKATDDDDDDKEKDEKKDKKKKDEGFKVDDDLPESCKDNVEWLKACALRIDDKELLGRAKTMQEAYQKIVKDKGKDGAETQCKNIQGIVKENKLCK